MADGKETANVKVQLVGSGAGGHTVEIAPGQRIKPLAGREVPRAAVLEWLPAGDGLYRAQARVCHWERLKRDNLERLGIGMNVFTLERLIRAGFVAGRKPAPNTALFDLMSFYEHLDRVAADEWFWEDEENLRKYRSAYRK